MRDTLNCARETLRRAGREQYPKTRKWANSGETQHIFAPLRNCAGEEAGAGNSVRVEHFPYSP